MLLEIYEQVLKISKDTEDWENYFEAVRGKIGLIRASGEEDTALKQALDAIGFIDELCAKIKNKKEKKEQPAAVDKEEPIKIKVSGVISY